MGTEYSIIEFGKPAYAIHGLAVYPRGREARRLTKFTRCARCGAVAPRVLGSARQRSRTAHKRDACFVRRHEPLRPH